jgi:hypothetical protein
MQLITQRDNSQQKSSSQMCCLSEVLLPGCTWHLCLERSVLCLNNIHYSVTVFYLRGLSEIGLSFQLDNLLVDGIETDLLLKPSTQYLWKSVVQKGAWKLLYQSAPQLQHFHSQTHT